MQACIEVFGKNGIGMESLHILSTIIYSVITRRRRREVGEAVVAIWKITHIVAWHQMTYGNTLLISNVELFDAGNCSVAIMMYKYSKQVEIIGDTQFELPHPQHLSLD